MSLTYRGLQIAIGYGLAALAGALASLAGLPLAWVLGPLLVAVALGMLGFEVRAPTMLRRAGQMTIGATVGLSMTGTVIGGLAAWFPLMVVTALAAILIAATFSVAFARLAKLDSATAFFAVMPGGLAEMGNIGASVGARIEPIAVIQALRVALIVCVVPPLLVATGLHTQPAAAHEIPLLPPLVVAGLLVAGSCGALLAGAVRLNNPWMIGSLLVSAMLTATGLVEGRMPSAVFAIAQVLIGFNIGSRFRRSVLRELPRVSVFGIVTVLFLMGAMAGFALVLHWSAGLDYASAVLVSSPGGTSEMAATAQVLNLNVALVTAFHVVRALLVNAFATYYWRVLSRAGFFGALNRMLDRLRGLR